MTIVELAQSIVEISTTSNNKRSFRMANNKYVQFKTEFDDGQYAIAGNQAFAKARANENLLPFVDPTGVSGEQPLTKNSEEMETALAESEMDSSTDTAVMVMFLIAQAEGTNSSNQPITDAFSISQYYSDKIQYSFTDGGEWPN